MHRNCLTNQRPGNSRKSVEQSMTKSQSGLGRPIMNWSTKCGPNLISSLFARNYSTNHRPENLGNSVENDKKLIRYGEYHNECIHHIWDQSPERWNHKSATDGQADSHWMDWPTHKPISIVSPQLSMGNKKLCCVSDFQEWDQFRALFFTFFSVSCYSGYSQVGICITAEQFPKQPPGDINGTSQSRKLSLAAAESSHFHKITCIMW